MKKKKLLRRLGELLDSNRRSQIKRRDSLRKVVKKLKQRERALQSELEGVKGDKKGRPLRKEIDVLRAQRKKGVRLLKELPSG